MKHKCNGCKYKGEHQEMGFRAMGVCLKETNLVAACIAYDADECPHAEYTADLVAVVRCKDCTHRDKKGVCHNFRQRYPFFPEDDFYCGYGAKMDGKGDTQ